VGHCRATDNGPELPVGLRLADWVAQVCDADALDDRRVAKDGWCAGEVVEESNPGAEEYRCEVDVDLVEETGIQALLDGVRAVDSDGLPEGGGSGLRHGAVDAVVTNCTVELGRGHPAGMWWVRTNAGPQA
jgi:hypothetical protein